ncbi:MAG: protein kinase [Myxococcota bacterium]
MIACPKCLTPFSDSPGTCPYDGATVTEDALDPRIGTQLGQYRILSCIGVGGMGIVYRGEHVHLGRPAAIKILHPRFASQDDSVSRFLAEARAVNRVRHESLIDIYDYFTDATKLEVGYVMELLEGKALRNAIFEESPLPLERLLAIMRQVCDGLAAVHDVGIIHRDLKPENIFLADGGGRGDRVKILDFGIAKFTQTQVSHQTQSGTTMGSPWYMAPEQARAEPLDARADVYSVGVILYEILTGEVPFPGENYAHVLAGHLAKAPPPMRGVGGVPVPPAMEQVVLRCLAKTPAERPTDMRALWAELRAAAPQAAPMNDAPSATRGARVVTPPPMAAKATSATPARVQTTLSYGTPGPREAAAVLAEAEWEGEDVASGRPRWHAWAGVGAAALALGLAWLALRGGDGDDEKKPRSSSAKTVVAPSPIPSAIPIPTPAPSATPTPAVAAEPAQARPASRAEAPRPASRAEAPRPASRAEAPRPTSRAEAPRPASRGEAPKKKVLPKRPEPMPSDTILDVDL